MKSIFFILVFVLGLSSAMSGQSFRSLDKSPLDVAYLPDHFAHDRKADQKAIVKVYYSQPQKKGRDVFGNMVPYGKVWRTGANEAVEIKTYQDVTIGGAKIKAGTYSLFTIPGKGEWTIIINSDLDYWGAYSYNKAQDVARFTVASSTTSDVVEAFSIRFAEKGNGSAVMRMAWDKTLIEIPITY